MLQHYSHIRLQAKRTALDALTTSRQEGIHAHVLDTRRLDPRSCKEVSHGANLRFLVVETRQRPLKTRHGGFFSSMEIFHDCI